MDQKNYITPKGFDTLRSEYTTLLNSERPKVVATVAWAASNGDRSENADYIYVKNWSSYEDYGKVISMDSNWMLTNEKLKLTNNAKVMHCLPVRRGIELADEILDGANSLVIHEAANRVWSAQAVLKQILENNF